jgi:hypothetical protein
VLHRLPIKGDRYFSLQLKWAGDLGLLAEVTDQLDQEGVQIKKRSVVRQPKTKSCEAVHRVEDPARELHFNSLARLVLGRWNVPDRL